MCTTYMLPVICGTERLADMSLFIIAAGAQLKPDGKKGSNHHRCRLDNNLQFGEELRALLNCNLTAGNKWKALRLADHQCPKADEGPSESLWAGSRPIQTQRRGVARLHLEIQDNLL